MCLSNFLFRNCKFRHIYSISQATQFLCIYMFSFIISLVIISCLILCCVLFYC